MAGIYPLLVVTIPTPSSEMFGFGFDSSLCTPVGETGCAKAHLSLDKSHSALSQSDLSRTCPSPWGLIIDDEDTKFIGELESVYSAFADVCISLAGGPIQLSTVFGMDDTMLGMESMTDPQVWMSPAMISSLLY